MKNLEKLLAEVRELDAAKALQTVQSSYQYIARARTLLPKLAEIVNTFINCERICQSRQDGALDDGDACRLLLRIWREEAEQIAGRE